MTLHAGVVINYSLIHSLFLCGLWYFPLFKDDDTFTINYKQKAYRMNDKAKAMKMGTITTRSKQSALPPNIFSVKSYNILFVF